MPLDAARVSDALNATFADIGVSTGITPPRSKRNTEGAAWEYLVASHLLRRAEARRKAAIRAAIGAGVIFDHEKAPLPAGTSQVVYAGDLVEIAVAVGTAARVLDVASFTAELVKAGVKQTLIDRLTAKHTSESRAPHKFTASIAG